MNWHYLPRASDNIAMNFFDLTGGKEARIHSQSHTHTHSLTPERKSRKKMRETHTGNETKNMYFFLKKIIKYKISSHDFHYDTSFPLHHQLPKQIFDIVYWILLNVFNLLFFFSLFFGLINELLCTIETREYFTCQNGTIHETL